MYKNRNCYKNCYGHSHQYSYRYFVPKRYADQNFSFATGPDEGKIAIVNSSSIYAALNINGNPDINAGTWTYAAQGGTDGVARTYIKFIGLDGMPDSAIILSATLSLYGISVGTAAPQGNSGYTGSPYSIDNQCWLKRVVADWNPDSLTWNNAPATTDTK